MAEINDVEITSIFTGGLDEEIFKKFTANNLLHWWHFRALLRANLKSQDYWQDSERNRLPDSEQAELIALSLMNYHVHSGIFEASIFQNELELELAKLMNLDTLKMINLRRFWKAAYSSLYTSYNAVCNIIYVLVTGESVFGKNKNRENPWNYTPSKTKNLLERYDHNVLYKLVFDSEQYIEIRNHLDHFWTIWTGFKGERFVMDDNFRKGRIIVDPDKELSATIDVTYKLQQDIFGLVKNLDAIYEFITQPMDTNLLENYLLKKEVIQEPIFL